jgi:hypothetical protein
VLVEICAARSAPPQRMPKTGRVGSSFSRASSCVMPRTIRTSPRRGTSCDDARVIRKSIDLVGKGWLDGQAVALTVGDVLVVEPGELHTFTDSSDDYRQTDSGSTTVRAQCDPTVAQKRTLGTRDGLEQRVR